MKRLLKFNVKVGRNRKTTRQIINLSHQKSSRVKNLCLKYKEIGFTDFSLIELAEMSLAQWRRREYPIPKGYRLNLVKILVKITDQSESLREKYFTHRY